MVDEDSKHDVWVRDLNERIKGLFHERIPTHILGQLGIVLGYRPVRWVDGRLRTYPTADGHLVLFADDVVALAYVRNEAARFRHSGDVGSTEVVVFRRDSLQEIFVPPFDESTLHNSSELWKDPGDKAWPSRGVRVDAVFPSRTIDLYENEGADGEESGTRLFEALLGDLAGRA